MSKLCHVCSNVLPETAKFCDQCGTKAISEKTCPQCHKKMPMSSKFCDECGSGLDSAGSLGTAPKAAAPAPASSSVSPKIKYGNTVENLQLGYKQVTGEGDMHFFVDQNKIYKIDNRSGIVEVVYTHPSSHYMMQLNVVNGRLYYCEESSIYSVGTDGSSHRLLVNLKERIANPGWHCPISFMIVIGDWIYFQNRESLSPLIARISVDGNNFQILCQQEVEDSMEGGYHIRSISSQYIHFEDELKNETLIMKTDGSVSGRPHQFFDYAQIIKHLYDTQNYTDQELRESFDREMQIIDFRSKRLYLSPYSNEYKRLSFDGSAIETYWHKADWNNQANNPSENRPNGFYGQQYFDRKERNIGFCYGGPHYYTLFRAYSDGKVVCLGGSGAGGGSEYLQVMGDWAYWGSDGRKTRQNIVSAEIQSLDLKNLKIEK